ncbi:hypothetical protein F5B19DRAFT_485607 [Rostrohypoxylon terebratum]|nr:hypothetical protein F5B19DRAFT_485607 [Rostrohypoxylon terebratum]
MPSLAVLKRSALVFMKDAKELRDGSRQRGSTNCTGIRGFIRRPREKIRKTNSTRARNKLKKDNKKSGVQYGNVEGENENQRVEGSGPSRRRGVGGVGVGDDDGGRVRNEGEDKNENEDQSTEALTLGLGLTFGSLGAFGARRARAGTGTSTSTFSASTGAGAGAGAGVASRQVSSTRSSSERPSLSPRSPGSLNYNKPLPSPPPPGTIDKVDGRPPKPVLKLNRIMASLTETEIEKLFSGAPQFFARSQGHGTGAPHPSVAFPWNDELGIRDLADHVQISDDAWGCITAWPRIIHRDPMSVASPSGKKRPHFNARCQERPSMLSMQGLEKGTIGYQAALEISVADALQEEQYGFDSLGSKGHVIVEQRQKLITSKDGLRHLDDSTIMEQLMKNEERYQAEKSGPRMKSQDLYDELFSKILHPPTRVMDPKEPHSLAVQISALVKVLGAPNAWIDFSRIEWRVRLGQILWAFPMDDEIFDGISINEGKDSQDRSEERYWLLLQILLACELLIRLDAITEGDEFGSGEGLKVSEVHRFEKEANISVKWSLILARAWLENINVTKTNMTHTEPSTPKGWLSSLTSKMNLKHEHMYGAHHVDHSQYRHNVQSEYAYAIQGRYTERQVYGLIHFARKLRWPDIQYSGPKIAETAIALGKGTSITAPPVSFDSRRSYFSGAKSLIPSRRQPSRRRKIEAALHASGWFSKSYVSGLILPGDMLSHYLMSALLEVDENALPRLGPRASLCGGFVYSGKSFWSTSCIVGRVLAAGQGAAECMGWISSDVVPRGLDEGWVNVAVDTNPADLARTGRKARIYGKTIIERESDVLGDAEPSNVLPADFIIPYENAYAKSPPSNIRAELKSLNLYAPIDSVSTTPTADKGFHPFTEHNKEKEPEIHTYPASTTFTISHDSLDQDEYHNFALTNDVNFVTAHPCVASSYVKYFKSPTSPTIQQIDVGGHDANGKSSSLAHVTGHPLHRYYNYTAIHLVDLISQNSSSLDDLLSKPAPHTHTRSSSQSSLSNKLPRFLVIDCITGFAPPQSPDMPSLSRMSSLSSSFGMEPTAVPPIRMPGSLDLERRPSTAASSRSRVERIDPPSPSPSSRMKLGTRRRQFGSDLEIMVRALCAERGWNAVISRRRRGCLACAIREAGALGWKVIVRVA